MAQIRIGTCSWKYPSWEGLVYSAPQGINYLEEYAARYDTVEVDQWFWSLFGTDSVKLPSPFDVIHYRQSVGADFRFSVKAPNSITLTHLYTKKKSDPLVANPHFLSPGLCSTFLSTLDPLGATLGPVMFQFEYLNKHKMPSQADFLRDLAAFMGQIPRAHTYAIEVRNPNYLNEPFFTMCREVQASPVLLQGYWMPPLVDVYDRWRSIITAHQTLVIRLLGPDRKGIEKATGKRWDQIVAPRDRELEGIAGLIKELNGLGIDVYLNINNHYEGSAPLTIQKVRTLLN